MLEVKDLSLPHFGQNLLYSVNLTVRPGEIACLIGPTGSGKSQLLRVLAAIEGGYTGRISINHYNLAKEPTKARLNLSYLESPINLPPFLTAYEYLSLIAAAYKIDGPERLARILELVGKFGADEYIYTTMDRLGPAFHQQVAVIAALLPKAGVMLLDEPVTYLDYSQQLTTIELLRARQKDGSAILVATNNLALVRELGADLACVNDGTITHSGSLKQLISQVRPEANTVGALYEKLYGGQ